MSARGEEALDALRPSRLLRAALALTFGLMLATGALDAARAVGPGAGRPDIVDFHPFHIAGRLALQGRFADSYDPDLMRALQRAEGGGRDVFMPFVYPPAFGLVAAPLALLPVAPAFLLFAGATLAFYLAVMRRLAGRASALAALVAAPAALIDLRIGQTGLLTGGLVGLSAMLASSGRGRAAGLAAGLLAFKPQAATGLALDLAARRDWRVLAVAALVAAAATALAMSSFGPGAGAGFRAALAYAGAFMAAGAFPLHRMVTVYACALSLGAPAGVALLVHGAAALAALGALAAALARTSDRAAASGLWIMSTAFLSPYFYDYDLTVFCVGLALALPALAEALGARRLGALLAAVAAAESLGLVLTPIAGSAALPSLGGPLLLACFAAMAAALRRGARGRLTGAPSAAVSAP